MPNHISRNDLSKVEVVFNQDGSATVQASCHFCGQTVILEFSPSELAEGRIVRKLHQPCVGYPSWFELWGFYDSETSGYEDGFILGGWYDWEGNSLPELN